jgi:diguanylate cyclase (GGDEF)-like protein/PAS domain S-box-containing protein
MSSESERSGDRVLNGWTGTHPASDILDSIGDAVLTTDLAGNVVYLNVAAEALTGWPRDAAVGRPLAEVFRVIDRATREPVPDPLALAVHLNRVVALTANSILVSRSGPERAIEDSAAPIHNSSGEVTGAVIVFRDVGAALETSRWMSHLAQHDVLTGLPNRLLLNDRLGQAIALGQRRRTALAVLFLDIDGFKDINDSLGHRTGDELLRSVAVRLRHALRPSDTTCRLGGDEFVVVLPEIEHTRDATLVANHLLLAVSGPYQIDDKAFRVTASIGIAICPDHGSDGDLLIARADAAMYDAKRGGRNCCRAFEVARQVAPVSEPEPVESDVPNA